MKTQNSDAILARGPGNRAIRLGMGLLVFAVSFFLLGYYVPLPVTNASVSARVGFNNLVPVAVLLVAVLFTGMRFMRSQSPGCLPDSPPGYLPLWTLGAALAAELVSKSLLAWATTGRVLVTEGPYFVNRLAQMGSRLPYKDFEFLFGPLLLYMPHWLEKLLHSATDVAYIAAWMLFGLTGTLLLWLLIDSARASRLRKGIAFVALAPYCSIGFDQGIQYTWLRYMVAPCSLLLAHRIMHRYPRLSWLMGLIWLALTVLCFAVSPEMGASFAAALVVLVAMETIAGERKLFAPSLCFLIGLGAVMTVTPSNLFLGVRNSIGSGFAFPVLPSPFTILFACTVLGVAAAIGQAAAQFLQGRPARLPFPVPLCAAMFGGSLVLLPSALGRCDPLHLCLNGSLFFLLALLGAWPGSIASQRLYGTSVLIVFTLLGISLQLGGSFPTPFSDVGRKMAFWAVDRHGSSGYAIRKLMGERRWSILQDRVSGAATHSFDRNLARLREFPEVCVPLGEADASSWLIRNHLLAPEYYYGMISVTTSSQVERKIADLGSCDVLVTGSNLYSWTVQPATGLWVRKTDTASERDFLRRILCAPWFPPFRIETPDVFSPFFERINSGYRIVETLPSGYYLYQRRDGTDPRITKAARFP